MAQPDIAIDVDETTGTWEVDGLPMVLVPQHFLVNNHRAVESALGVEAYQALLAEAGHRSAYRWCEQAARVHGLDGAAVVQLYLHRLSQRGWGLFEAETLDTSGGRATIRVRHSVFVRQYGVCGRRVDYMFNGWWAGALEYAARTAGREHRLRSSEVRCAAEGGAADCLFEVTPA